MDDRPRREQEDRLLTRAIDLVVQAHPVALDVAGAVGVARTRLLPPSGTRRISVIRGCRTGACRRGHGRASNTRLNGVSAARRKRVKPAAVTTSRILASPAWAPSASPTSCDSEAGVRRRGANREKAH